MNASPPEEKRAQREGPGSAPRGPSPAAEGARAGLGRALAAIVAAVSRHPWLVLLAALAVATGGAWAAATQLRVNADQDAMFSDELPHRVVEIAYMREFPALYENVVVVLDGDDDEAVHEATDLLAARMEAAPESFANVYLPRGDFFEQHALLYMSTSEIEDFADRLARVQPYLAGLAEDGTLRGLATLLARGTRAAYEGDVAGEELEPIFARIEQALRARIAGEAYRFSWAEGGRGPGPRCALRHERR